MYQMYQADVCYLEDIQGASKSNSRVANASIGLEKIREASIVLGSSV